MQLEPTVTTETSTTTETPAGGAGEAGAGTAAAASGTSNATDDTTILGKAAAAEGTGTPEGGKPPEGTPPAAGDDDSVPETYDLKLTKVGEDGTETTIEMDKNLLEVATPVLKDLGLSNAKASKLVELVPQIQERVLSQMNDDFAATRANWSKEAQADPDIGGKNWTETQQLAAKALDHFTGPADNNEFRKLLNDSGLGNHPAMIRAWREVGKAISEDGTFVRNTTTVEVPKPREERNYPNDVPKN